MHNNSTFGMAIIPAFLLSVSVYMISSSLLKQVNFTKKEIKGLEFIQLLSPLVNYIEDIKIYSHSYYLPHKKNDLTRETEIKNKISSLLENLHKRDHFRYFNTTEKITSIQNRLLAAMHENNYFGKIPAIFYAGLSYEIQQIASKVQNDSGLVLDYELKSYKLMSVSFNLIPYLYDEMDVLSRIYGDIMLQNVFFKDQGNLIIKILNSRIPVDTTHHSFIQIYKNFTYQDLDKEYAVPFKTFMTEVAAFNDMIINDSLQNRSVQRVEDIIEKRKEILRQGKNIQSFYYNQINILLNERLNNYYLLLFVSYIAFISGVISFVTLLIRMRKANKKIFESNFLLNAVINAIPARVYWKGLQLEYLGCNDMFAFDAGLSATSDIIGKSEKDLIPGRTRNMSAEREDKEVMNTLVPVFNKEESMENTQGDKLWLLVNKIPLVDQQNHTYGLLGTYTNITLRKKMENDLGKAYQEIKEQNEELNQYTYVVSHDLKSPLRAIHNYSDFLYEDLGSTLSGDQKLYLDGMKKAVVQSEQLVNDLLELSKIGKNNNPSVRVDLREMVKSIIETIHIPENSSVIIDEKLPVVETEVTLLRQAMQNLISNGLKFNKSEKKLVEISLAESRLPDHFLISVRDNGIGIDEKYYQQIFKVFQRLHTQKEYEGTGIGLAIVKKTLERIGGSIRIESILGQGATFFVSIPQKIKVKELVYE